MLKIIVIDDHILLRDMIVDTLNNEKDFNVVGISNDAKDAPELCAKSNPDVLLMDICTANNSNGIAFAKIVKKNHPNIKIIIMTGILDVSFINEAKQIGIESFIYKNISKDSLVSTIKNTANGYSIYPNSNRKENTSDSILSELTDKEMQILKLYCRLLDKDAVAEALSISPRTLKSHIHSIYD